MNSISLSQLALIQIPPSQFLQPEYEMHVENFLQQEGVKSNSPLFELLRYSEDFPHRLQQISSLLTPHQNREVTIGELLDSLGKLEISGAEEFIDSYKNLDPKVKASIAHMVHTCLVLGFIRLTHTWIKKLDDKSVNDPINLLYISARQGVLEVWEALESKGGTLPSSKSAQAEMIHLAVIHNNLPFLQFLLRKGVTLELCEPETQHTALHVAAENGYLPMAECLLDAGANPNPRDLEYRTPLYLALKNGHSPVVDLLYSRGARSTMLHDIMYQRTRKWTYYLDDAGYFPTNSLNGKRFSKLADDLIHIAAKEGALKVIKGLVGKDISIEQQNLFGHTPLLIAAQCGQLRIVVFLLKKGANAHYISRDGTSILEAAVKGNNLDVVKRICNKKVNLNHQNLLLGKTALHYAVQTKNISILSYLLNHLAYPNLIDYYGQTPLDQAKEENEIGIMSLLEKHGAKAGYGKQFPIHWAVKENQIELLDRFLGFRIGLSLFSAPEDFDYTPDDPVEESCYITEAKEYNALDYLHRTALHWAAEKNHTLAADILVRAGVDLNIQDLLGNTPLHLAVKEGHVFMVDFLMSWGLHNSNLRNCENKRPLDLAIEKLHCAISVEEKDRYNRIFRFLARESSSLKTAFET